MWSSRAAQFCARTRGTQRYESPILYRMERPPNQMRIAAALATAKRCNKFVILHNKGMLFQSAPAQPRRERGACPPSSSLAPHSAVSVPRPGDHRPYGRWRGNGDSFFSNPFAPFNWGMALYGSDRCGRARELLPLIEAAMTLIGRSVGSSPGASASKAVGAQKSWPLLPKTSHPSPAPIQQRPQHIC